MTTIIIWMRVMALDYGERNVGVAISDEQQFIERVCELVVENEVGALVVGLPLNMDGARGAAAEQVESFVSDLRRRVSIPIATVDERLTSREADRILREMGVGLRERRARSDEYAASLILQDYIDEQKRRSSPSETPRQ
jgi:putative holliday junction resolvase